MSEPGAGSDAVRVCLRAGREDDRYLLNHSKIGMCAAIGPGAEILTDLRPDRRGSRQPGIAAFLVGRVTAVFGTAQKLDKFGRPGSFGMMLRCMDIVLPRVHERAFRPAGRHLASAN